MSTTPIQCRVCGADCQKSHDNSRPAKFCSRRCFHASRKGQPLDMSPDVARKARRKAVRNAARKTSGVQQSPEHKEKRLKRSWASLAAVPKACTECGESFIRTSPSQRYCTGRCWLAAHRRGRVQKKRFTIPVVEYRRLLALQDNRCAICRSLSGSNGRNDRLAVDHCHGRNVLRGLLCHRCNTAIGLLRDDLGIIESAIRYLEEHGAQRPTNPVKADPEADRKVDRVTSIEGSSP
jgi:hypothetical protein